MALRDNTEKGLTFAGFLIIVFRHFAVKSLKKGHIDGTVPRTLNRFPHVQNHLLFMHTTVHSLLYHSMFAVSVQRTVVLVYAKEM